MVSTTSVTVQSWQSTETPDEVSIHQLMTAEGLKIYRWSNAPAEVYDAHTHDFHKVVYVVDGSITFNLPEHDQSLYLKIGDRMDLPAGIVHEAVVGDDGVVCLEGHRY